MSLIFFRAKPTNYFLWINAVEACVHAIEIKDYKIVLCIHGYHIYQTVLDAALCVKEPANTEDSQVVAIRKDGTTVGHLGISHDKFTSEERSNILVVIGDNQEIYQWVVWRFHVL